MSAPTMSKARRGDLVAIVSTRTTYTIGQPTTTKEEVELAVVDGVTREGKVRTVRDVYGSEKRRIDRWVGFRQCLVIERERVDVDGAMDGYADHRYVEGKPGVRPFSSVDECREFVRRFLIEQLAGVDQ